MSWTFILKNKYISNLSRVLKDLLSFYKYYPNMCTYFNEIQSLGKMVSKRVDRITIIKVDTREGACTCVTSIGSWWWNNRIIWRFKSNEKLHPTHINRRVFLLAHILIVGEHERKIACVQYCHDTSSYSVMC